LLRGAAARGLSEPPAQRTPLLTLWPQHALVDAPVDALIDRRAQDVGEYVGRIKQA
jgi:hypothetical protein